VENFLIPITTIKGTAEFYRGGKMSISILLNDGFSADDNEIENLTDEQGILKQLIERLVERGHEVDLAQRIRNARYQSSLDATAHRRSGASTTSFGRRPGKRQHAFPRLRCCGRTAPILPKCPAGPDGFGDKIRSPYASSLKMQAIQPFSDERYSDSGKFSSVPASSVTGAAQSFRPIPRNLSSVRNLSVKEELSGFRIA
jgi:transposase-like protein